MSDAELRAEIGQYPVPLFEQTAFTSAPPLREATVAVVTTAGLRHPDQPDWGFDSGDQSFRILDGTSRALLLSHISPNFDRTGFAADPNVVMPLDRLQEMAAEGGIRAVSAQHLSFVGNQDETMAMLRLASGPAAAQVLRANGVDVVLLTPV